MKNLLQTLGNLVIWYNYTFASFWGVLWYGKLPKVSYYHWFKKGELYTAKGIYNDVNHQVISVDDVPTKIKQKIIDNYINSLYDNEVFKNNVASLDIPIFDGKEIIGNQCLYNVLREVKEQQV